MPFKVLLFDLGNVLVELRDIREIFRSEVESNELILENWTKVKAQHLFGIGKISPKEFAENMVNGLNLSLTEEVFLDHYRQMVKGYYPGVIDLLIQLRPGYHLACLSNTNSFHWTILRDEMGIMDLFDGVYLSHEMGLEKPDARIFNETVKQIGVLPEEVAFFDDNQANVNGAAECGLQAFLVKGFPALKGRLDALEVIR